MDAGLDVGFVGIARKDGTTVVAKLGLIVLLASTDLCGKVGGFKTLVVFVGVVKFGAITKVAVVAVLSLVVLLVVELIVVHVVVQMVSHVVGTIAVPADLLEDVAIVVVAPAFFIFSVGASNFSFVPYIDE